MFEKRRTQRKSVYINEGTLAHKWIENRPKGLSIQDQIEEAFRALEQLKRPETKEEKAKSINKECQLKITELFPSALPVYQLAGILISNIIHSTTVPEKIWELYRKEIESAIQPSFENGRPQNKSGLPVQPERLSAVWFERELFNSSGMLQAYSNDSNKKEYALNWLHNLKDQATEIQKTNPFPEINSILQKINDALDFSNSTHPMKE